MRRSSEWCSCPRSCSCSATATGGCRAGSIGSCPTSSWSPLRRGRRFGRRRTADGGRVNHGPVCGLLSAVCRINLQPPVFCAGRTHFRRLRSMRLSKPSPGTVIATVALVMAMTPVAVAATVNADRVDGLSAVGASSSLNRAAGNLVATARGGSNKGQIPNKFLADVPAVTNYANAFTVEDNQTGATIDLAGVPFGRISISCQDQAAAAGTEDPRMVISFTNTSGGPVNVYRRVGVGDASIAVVANGTV